MRISALITLHNKADLIRALANAPVGAQFDLADAPRTISQNRLLCSLERARIRGSDRALRAQVADAGDWKCIFHEGARGKEPSLSFPVSMDRASVSPLAIARAASTKEEMSQAWLN